MVLRVRELPPHVEEHRDERWCRDATRCVTTVLDAERFIEQVGFAAALTDSRRSTFSTARARGLNRVRSCAGRTPHSA